MNVFNKCFILLELLVQLSCAVSYTVVLKQVKPLHPPVKVYRYEWRHKILPDSNTHYVYHKPLLGQRLYPVLVKPGRDGNYKARVPVKKEKGKHYKVSSTTERAASRDSRLLGLSQHLVPPVSNQIEEYSEAKEPEPREEENDVRPLPASPNAGKSFPSFGQEKGRIYGNPGEWATPVPQADSENTTKAEFTPSQLYLQIRHKNTVIHVPQSEALKDAETLEELINAPRLKELSRTTHVQETYSEEGYEDAGYDHAGHIRQAQHGEVYDAKDEGRFQIKEAPVVLDYDSDLEESKKVPLKNENVKNLVEENLSNKLEPRTTNSRSEIGKTSAEYAKVPQTYKGEHKYSSRVRGSGKTNHVKEAKLNLTDAKEFPGAQATFPSYFDEMPPTPEALLGNDTVLDTPPEKKSSKYRKTDFNSTQIYPIAQSPTDPTPQINEYTDFKPYLSIIDSQPSPSAKSLKYSRIYSKKTKQLRLEPYKKEHVFPPPPPVVISPPPPPTPSPPHEVLQPPKESDKIEQEDEEEEEEEEEPTNERIVLPTIGYINSLTTAHFGKENSKPPQEETKPQLTDALSLTQALTYLRMNKNQNREETTKSPTEIDIRTFEPMKLKKSRPKFGKTKRDVYLTGMQNKPATRHDERQEGNDESDLAHDEKNEEIAEDERKRMEEEKREKEKYESDLKHEISNQERQILKETFRNIGVEDDVSEIFPEFPETEFPSPLPKEEERDVETTPTPVNTQKYPFYLSKMLPENSPLRYATDPKQFPKKSGYKMEFYESRERLIQCPDIHPNLDDLPDSNSTEYSEEQAGDKQRVTRVGDKIACLRMKYFDPEPFDNPIFKEKEIDYVGKPAKLRKKVRGKIFLKTSGEGDQKLQQTVRQVPFVVKLNQKLSASKQSPKTINAGRPEAKHQQTKPQFSPDRPKTNESRIIPVTEIVDDFPPSKPFQNLPNPVQVIGWRTTYHSKHEPRAQPQPSVTKPLIVKPHDCLPHISKLAALDGSKNLIIECNDVILIQEVTKNVPRLRIIPKEKQKKVTRKKWSEHGSLERNDWVPIAGYVLPKQINKSARPLSRRTDEVTLKNETSQNTSSAHYVIDELKEDENVRKGEVVEDMDHYMKLIDEAAEVTTAKVETKTENSTRRRREAENDQVKQSDNVAKGVEFGPNSADKSQNAGKGDTYDSNSVSSKPFAKKRPLTRLSGLDFLTRYHKNKGKSATQKTEDFWKVTTAAPATNKNIPKPQKTSAEVQKSPRTTSKSKEDTLARTTPLPIPAVTSTKKYEVKGTSEIRKQPANSAERYNKPKIKQTNEYRKISPLNIIPEKITKRPESKTSDFWKTSTQKPERATAKSQNFTKTITKAGRETSENGEKPRTSYKQSSHSLSTETPTARTSSAKPEPLQYKTINRSSVPAEETDSRRSTENPKEPVLYYVVNLKTGRGKWITNYEEHRKGSSGKVRKLEKSRENSTTKRNKRRKKPKY